MKKQRLLIVDDEQDMLEGLQRVLACELNNVEIVASDAPREVMHLMRRRPFDLVLLDLRMPEIDGMELLESLREHDPSPTIVMMTAFGDIETAVSAIKQGAYDFITKPFRIPDLLRVLEKGLERCRLIDENNALRRKVGEPSAWGGLTGQSPPMLRLIDTIKSLAPTDYAVLIRGESGTGKELVARAIHDLSKRSAKPLVAINCPAIPEHLLESELFGHHKGAFTGAVSSRKGLFEEADGSSLLLDEIADIPVTVQTKMLRVLQEQQIRPLGSTRGFHVDVRILSTTNQNLEEKIRDRSFREDLYYRLNVVSIFTPSLREMREDIPLLAKHFVRRFCAELEAPLKNLAPAALKRMSRHDWPGNVRELQNAVRRLVVFSAGDEIGEKEVEACLIQCAEEPSAKAVTTKPEEIPLYAGEEIPPYAEEKIKVITGFTETYVDRLLQKTAGNVAKAARMAGLSRQALQKILHREGIDPDDYRGAGQ
jgi:DNA-binding NtrC family response regulator